MNGVRKEQSVGLALVRDSLLRCVGVGVGVGAEDFGGVINARVADVDSSCNNKYFRRCVYMYRYQYNNEFSADEEVRNLTEQLLIDSHNLSTESVFFIN